MSSVEKTCIGAWELRLKSGPYLAPFACSATNHYYFKLKSQIVMIKKTPDNLHNTLTNDNNNGKNDHYHLQVTKF